MKSAQTETITPTKQQTTSEHNPTNKRPQIKTNQPTTTHTCPQPCQPNYPPNQPAPRATTQATTHPTNQKATQEQEATTNPMDPILSIPNLPSFTSDRPPPPPPNLFDSTRTNSRPGRGAGAAGGLREGPRRGGGKSPPGGPRSRKVGSRGGDPMPLFLYIIIIVKQIYIYIKPISFVLFW